jgi:hypothetical protein
MLSRDPGELPGLRRIKKKPPWSRSLRAWTIVGCIIGGIVGLVEGFRETDPAQFFGSRGWPIVSELTFFGILGGVVLGRCIGHVVNWLAGYSE